MSTGYSAIHCQYKPTFTASYIPEMRMFTDVLVCMLSAVQCRGMSLCLKGFRNSPQELQKGNPIHAHSLFASLILSWRVLHKQHT